MAKSSAPAVLTIIALAGVALAGCTVLHPADEVKTQPATAAADPKASDHPQTAPEPEPAAGSPGEAPVLWRPDEAVPPVPDGPTGVATPNVIIEKEAVYITPPSWRVPVGLAPTEMPKPKRPGPRSRAFPASGATATAESPDVETAPAGGTGEDGGTAEGGGTAKLGGPSTPAFLTKFDSLDFDDNTSNSAPLAIPADASGAAGTDHVINVTNVSIQIHDKDGTEVLGASGASLASFFTAKGCSPFSGNFTFDPKVLYDQHADRYLVVTLDREDIIVFGDLTDDSQILLAVSDDGDISGALGGTWYCTTINSKLMIDSADRWADYPGFAVDEEAVYITANMFGFGGGSFAGTRLWVVEKGEGSGGFYDALGTAAITLLDPYGASADCLTSQPFCGTTQPAHVYGTPSSSPNVGTWLTYFNGLTAFDSEFLQVMRLDDPLGTPTFLGPEFVNLGDIDDNSGDLPDAPQMGPNVETIETNNRRTLDSVWRDDSLYVTTTVDPESGDPDDGEATAHWVHLDTSVLTGSPPPIARVDQGGIGGEDIATDTHTFFPSIAVNSAGDVAIGFSASALTIYPGSYYTIRAADDAAGTTRGAVELEAGLDEYIRTFDATGSCAGSAVDNRWGDYSAIAIDPADECFWVYNQHAITEGTPTTGGCNGRPDPEEGRWGTAFGRACFCSETFDLTTGEWKQISMTCDQTDANRTLDDVFGDDMDGVYETDWIVKSRDPVAGINVTLALTDEMEVGRGYWIKTNETSQTVDNEGIDNVETEAPLDADDTDGTGCGSSAGLCNLVGHPHRFDVCWADVEVIDGVSTLSLAMADPSGVCQGTGAEAAGCVMSRVAYKWTGSAYAPFDGETMGMEGTLVDWDGFWVSAVKDGIKLKIPAVTSNCGDPQRATQRGGGWYIRLIVESDGLEDLSNVIGQLPDSVDGYDSHDLLELFPLDPYLSVVFPHPVWGDRADDYTSDYHQLRDESEPDAWAFEVRSSDPTAEITLRWEGPESRLLGSILTDLETGEQVAVAPGGSYTFIMTDTTRSFFWGYLNGDLIFADGFESGDTSNWD